MTRSTHFESRLNVLLPYTPVYGTPTPVLETSRP